MQAVADDKKPWLKNYPKGVPAEIGSLPYKTVPQMVSDTVHRFPDRVAYENFGVGMTYREIDRHSLAFATYLQSSLGLKKGDRVAIMMPNMLQYPIALFGIHRAGLVVVSVNPLYTARELEHQLKDSGSTTIVIFEGAAQTLQSIVKNTPVKNVIIAAVGDMLGFPKGWIINLVLRHVKKMVPAWDLPGHIRFNDALAKGAHAPFAEPPLDGDDLAFLQYTGGTTGVSKGAMLSHKNVLSDVEQMRTFFTGMIEDDNNVAVGALPFYHILALVLNCLLFFRLGGRQILITNPRDITRLIKTLEGSGFNFFVGVNTLFNALLNHPEFGRLDFSKSKMCGGGGAPIQLAIAERWKEKTGVTLVEGYGLTEVSGACSCNPPQIAKHTGTTGFPIPSTDIEIRDDQGRALPMGEVGQVCIRGPQVMRGYWQRPEETTKVISADGYFYSGDLGLITPEGYLKIVDRLKDMILVSGFNVYPNEIEDVLATHSGILESAVIGIADEQSGEAVKAFVVRKDPALTAEAIIAHCRANLTGYKVPRQIEFRDTLPKSPIGKILRKDLRPKA